VQLARQKKDKLSFELALDPKSLKPLDLLRPIDSMRVFVEPIDFTLDSTVPDPQPFEAKLRSLLEGNKNFITSKEGRDDSQDILIEVGKCSNLDGSTSNLETEQEREQEQEQQKEVKARRDQQVEIEKFVEREYSRNQEEQTPWPISVLMQTPPSRPFGDNNVGGEETEEEHNFPFYKLEKFKLFNHHESLSMPQQLLCSKNYFNDKWSGLRRLKNTIMVMEWSPKSISGELSTPEANISKNVSLTQNRKDAIRKSFLLLGGNKEGGMNSAGIRDTIEEITDLPAVDGQIPAAISAAFDGSHGQRDSIDLSGFTSLLQEGHFLPSHSDRYFVALSLLEAETILRVLHIRGSEALLNKRCIAGASCSPEVAIRFSPLSTPGLERMGDGGVAFGASSGWQAPPEANSSNLGSIARTGATSAEAAVSHSTFRFFDCDMHYSEPQVNVLIRSLQTSSTLCRERFFTSTIGVRRRMARKWQDTPLAKVFLLEDEYAALKRRAQACFVRNKLKEKGLKNWDAFVAFDSNDKGHLSPDDIYGALRYLGMPDLTPSDVADFLEAGDTKRNGMLDYKEYLGMLGGEDEDGEITDDKKVGESDTSIEKVGAYGAVEMRQELAERRRAYQEKMHTEQIRRNVQQAELEIKIYEEELTTSASRAGGANPKRLLPDTNCNYYGVEFSFTSNKPPIRTVVTGNKLQFCGVLHDRMRRIALAGPILVICPGCSMKLQKITSPRYYDKCKSCHKSSYYSNGSPLEYSCNNAWSSTKPECYKYFLCHPCFKAKKKVCLQNLANDALKETYVQCPAATTFSLLIPSEVIIGSTELGEKLSNVVSSVIGLKEKSKLKVEHVSKMLVDRFIRERFSQSTKTQHDLLRTQPKIILVSGAGTSFVNGLYSCATQINDTGFVKPGTDIRYEHHVPNDDPYLKNKKITLFQRTMCTGRKWWFLSEVDVDQTGADKNVDYYQHKSKTHEESEPSLSGWVTCKISGTDPAPNLEVKELVVPIRESSSTHVSILTNYQTKCRLLLDQRDILEDRVKKDLGTLLESRVPEKLADTPLPKMYHTTATKSTLFSGSCLDVCFTAFIEFRMPSIPVAGHRAALLRLEPPPVKVGGDFKRQEASIYIQEGGVLTGSQVELKTEGEECVKAYRWHLLTAVVDCISGVLNLYLDGKFVRTVKYSSNINAPKLGLGSRLIVFGGGNQSESRGGEVRLIRLIDGALTKMQMDNTVSEMRSINPLYRVSATVIQALVRGKLTRTRFIALGK